VEATCSFQTLGSAYVTTTCRTPEDHSLFVFRFLVLKLRKNFSFSPSQMFVCNVHKISPHYIDFFFWNLLASFPNHHYCTARISISSVSLCSIDITSEFNSIYLLRLTTHFCCDTNRITCNRNPLSVKEQELFHTKDSVFGQPCGHVVGRNM